MWDNFGSQTGITKLEFNNYYKENTNAFGIKIKEVKSLFNHSIKLDNLKMLIPGFIPPQTYSYIDKSLINFSSLRELISE
ncbi:hypothetical protein JCM19298_1924 [Nonlabens ulvanivorans]|nr:hypothetical protein JCM19298_1924 [Nonlabens ulvanivorans]